MAFFLKKLISKIKIPHIAKRGTPKRMSGPIHGRLGTLDFYNYIRHEAHTSIDFHRHTGYEIVYYQSGRGTTTLGKATYRYQAGTFTVIAPELPHDEHRHTDTELMFVGFDYSNAPVPLRTGLYSDSPDGAVGRLLKRMGTEIAGKASYYDIKLDCLLTETIVEIGRLTNSPAAPEPEEKLIYAQNYFQQYYADQIDLAGLARTLGYSYDYFRHLFKAQTGYSPMQYIVDQRMKRARQLLSTTDKSVTTVALECGFSNAPQFCMLFKKQHGQSPGNYRKHVEETSANWQ
ncbi:AraC family transcriptional regulator [Paenibacillaceae bacterium]|nr:AraC family transcriptional regulator [Paenibacillaceae bacterium]